jgi:hypothetical protein
MRQVFSFAAAGLAAALVMSSPVQAATITVTLNGVVSSGTDTAGYLGAPGADLAGRAFSLVQTIDTTQFGGEILDPSGREWRVTGSGATTFAIDSNKLGPFSTSRGTLFRSNGRALLNGFNDHGGGDAGGGLQSFFNVSFQTEEDPTFRLDETDSGPATANFTFRIAQDEFLGPSAFNANLVLQSWSTTMVVPEPATWALLILGFGGVGAMLRTRRRHLQAA